MQKNKKYLSIIGLFILNTFFYSCSKEININDYIDKNTALRLTDNSNGITTLCVVEIAANSEKFKEIIEWGSMNEDGWQWTPATYLPGVSVRQGGFLLMRTKDGKAVVISFTGKDGKSQQYSKTIDKGELDFLTK